MTYVSKGEKIFRLPDRTYSACDPPAQKRSDGRLKTFPSIMDDRVWSIDEKQRYRYLYDLVSGSQTCLTISCSCFKYVPLEDLINLLMCEKDDYIKCLEHQICLLELKSRVKELEQYVDLLHLPYRLDVSPTSAVDLFSRKYRSNSFTRDFNSKNLNQLGTFDQKKVSEMEKEIAALTAELAECKTTRDTLRQAMHKLENIDEIVNENEHLKSKLRCSEEIIKILEEEKCKLESELDNLRTKSQVQLDLRCAQETLDTLMQKEKCAEGEELFELARERDALQKMVEELQCELLDARSRQSQLELLKKQSETTSLNLEKIVRENECYKKKLSSMKCLEKQIGELKKQANQLSEKYKRDAAKSGECEKKMKEALKELESLRCERDNLKKQVNELACYESQYNSLQCKLRQVDSIIAENESLNCKLASLSKLEVENQFLRCKLEQCHVSEMEAAEGKEKIMELQSAVADQEEEMKDLLCQIERLTRAYGDNDELTRLKEELSEKDCKLKLCEEQLAEIPLLEAEIDKLRGKLENCYNDIVTPSKKPIDRKTSRGEETLEEVTIGARYEESVEFGKRSAIFDEVKKEEAMVIEKIDKEKDSMTCEEAQGLLQSSRGIISCVLEDMIEHQKEMEELEKCNKEMKDEICILKAKIGKTDLDDCLQQIAVLSRTIQEKELKICCLEQRLATDRDLGKVNEHISNLENEIEYLKGLNKTMRADLEDACCEVQRCAELECLLEEEKRARAAAEEEAKRVESRKSEDLSKLQKEEFNLEAKESSLKDIEDLKNQVEELTNLVEELKKENAILKDMQPSCPDFVKELEEKRALENLLNMLQCELDTCRQEKDAEDCEGLRAEIKRLKDQNCQLKGLVNCYKERLDLERCSKEESPSRSSNSKSSNSSCLQDENHKLRSEIVRLRCELAALCKMIQEHEKRICEQAREINQLKGCCKNLEERNSALEREVDEKDNESAELKQEVSRLIDETYKLSSDNDVLQNRLKESEGGSEQPEVTKMDYERDLSEKHEIENAMRGVETQVDGLKDKLDKAETEKAKMLQKQANMEAEIEDLKKKLAECMEKEVTSVGQTEMEPSVGTLKAVKPTKAAEGATPTSKSTQTVEDSKTEQEQSRVAEPMKKPEAPETADREEKLLEDMKNMREDAVKLQAEADSVKAENKKLKNEIDELKKLLDEYKKQMANEEAQASLKSSKVQGVSYPILPAAQVVPATVIPVKEEQRASVYERGTSGEITQTAGRAKAAVIENAAPQELLKVVEEDSRRPSKLPQEGVKTAEQRGPVKRTEVSPATETPKVETSKAAVPKDDVKPTGGTTKAAKEETSKPAVAVKGESTKIKPGSDKEGLSREKAAGKAPSAPTRSEKAAAAAMTDPTRLHTSLSDESSVVDFSEIDPDFQQFLCSLNPANHKQNICEIEKRYRKKMCELQKKNDEKVKALIKQYEKEFKVRDKAYSEGLSNVRNGYETDIRKMVERHKASIMRLQSLHEDEVQELNVNYEIQMEVMQTQNENIVNDLTTGATEKFKMLAEQHNQDIRNLERKYQQLLLEKESQHGAEISNLQSNLTQNMNDVEKYHTEAVTTMTQALEGNITDVQTRHNRELKKLKRSNLKRIDLLKHKYEDLIMCERRKYEKQLEDMVQRLRAGKPVTEGICQCRFTSCDPKDPEAPIEFIDVIQKILSEGLESLTFNEVALVHKRTCAATEDIVLKPEVKAQLVPAIADDPCTNNQLMKANKEELLSRILVLENEIAIKQMETQHEIVNMEMAVKAERKRLQELRDSLRSERQINSELKTRLSKTNVQTKMETQVSSIRERDILQKMQEIQREISGSQRPELDRDNARNMKRTDMSAESGKGKPDHSKYKATAKKKYK